MEVPSALTLVASLMTPSPNTNEKRTGMDSWFKTCTKQIAAFGQLFGNGCFGNDYFGNDCFGNDCFCLAMAVLAMKK